MINYARIEAGKVVEVHECLPANWRHISNFYMLGLDERALATHGWYRVQRQAYDMSEFVPSAARYVFDGTSVRESLTLAPRLAVPIADAARTAMRIERDRLLVASDWTQANDLVMRFEAWAGQWAAYRQALRDFPLAWEQSGRIEPFPAPPGTVPSSARVTLIDTADLGGAPTC